MLTITWKIVLLIQACVILVSLKGAVSQLTKESVSEGECVANIASKAGKNLNFLWFASMRTYYVPIASEACFRGYAEVLLGRPVDSEEELMTMKLRIRATFPLPPIFLTYGFTNPATNRARQIVQICPPVGIPQILCLPIKSRSSNGTDTSGINTSLDTVYYTDNKTTMLIVRCLNSKVKDYKVLTIGPTVDEKTRAILVTKIQELGFNPDLMKTLTY